ncbi:cell wall-binding repeat-containing protein [Kineococcus rhizosphaerae]|uniref:Putative cell wall binding repeat protein n=1 Tax=Kineococcus rhizosphaerae TaxID=559628 RepID=A0A2T0R2F6_9ACTN|nr:cell wall-binding repeat-containing protein [Kineococcus rhizosphaerae]PRY13955.1 putative cell wall binding repeat protein [Kineococcus rhizosphaerae]
MTAATSRLRRRGIGAGVAALVGLSGLGLAAVPAQAAAGFDPAASQVSGVDRFDTAARVATTAFTTADTVVVANGDRAIDAQAGAYAAGLNKAPLLLTQKSNVPTFTVDAIKKLGATKAIVLGDTNSVDATALAQMTAAGLSVQVVAGANRFDTAAKVYNLASTKATTVFLARADLLAGQVSPDALAASPLSYDGTPVLLTNANSLPAETAAAITSGGVKNVVVLGNAITDSVKTAVGALGATVTTLAGDDRSLTAQKIAEYGITQNAYGTTAASIANGDKIDALAAGPWAAINKAPILLTLGTGSLGTGTSGYLATHASTLKTATVFGDVNSVPASLTAAAKTAGGGDVTSNQAYTIAGGGATVPASSSAAPTAGSVQYSVSGLDSTKTYSIALVPASSISTNASGATLFADADGTANVADGTQTSSSTGAQISVVNGVSATGSRVTSVTPAAGSITFAVNSSTYGNVRPVVWLNSTDAALSSGLDLAVPTSANANPKAPVEAFAVGAATVWTPAEATGSVTAATVTSVASDKSSAVLFDGTDYANYVFKSGDVYAYDGNTTSQAQFLSALSVGDTVTASTYSSNFQSTFDLVTDIPAAPAAPAVTSIGNLDDTSASNYDVKFSVTPASPAAGLVDHYDVNVYAVDATTGLITGTAVQTVSTTGSATTATVFNLPNAKYGATVTAVSAEGSSSDESSATYFTVQKGDADTVKPTVVSTTLTEGSGISGVIDDGDSITLQFSEAVTVGSTAALRFTDADGEVFQITNSATDAWTVGNYTNAAGATVTNGQVVVPVTTANLAKVGGTVPSSPNVAQVPGTINAFSTTVTDAAGNTVNLTGSTDLIIDTPLG